MNWLGKKKYITARAIIIQDGKLLVFHRKRKDKKGQWLEYYSIPGGEIERDEQPERAVVRELQEEMGVDIVLHGLAAHYKGRIFEHYVYHADITSGVPHFMDDSQEAMDYVSETNQYVVMWVPVKDLTKENLKFYGIFHGHITALAAGKTADEVRSLKF